VNRHERRRAASHNRHHRPSSALAIAEKQAREGRAIVLAHLKKLGPGWRLELVDMTDFRCCAEPLTAPQYPTVCRLEAAPTRTLYVATVMLCRACSRNPKALEARLAERCAAGPRARAAPDPK
jgi:hypothetical protein